MAHMSSEIGEIHRRFRKLTTSGWRQGNPVASHQPPGHAFCTPETPPSPRCACSPGRVSCQPPQTGGTMHILKTFELDLITDNPNVQAKEASLDIFISLNIPKQLRQHVLSRETPCLHGTLNSGMSKRKVLECGSLFSES